MEVSGSPDTLHRILEKCFLTSHCSLQRGCTEATVVVAFAAGFSTKQIAKMLSVFLNNFLTNEVLFLFSYAKKQNLVKEFFYSFLQKEMKTLSML